MNPFRLVSAGLAVCAAMTATAAEPIDPQGFDRLHALIKPHEIEQAWEEIPWMTDLWQARRRAAEQGKPILLWEMDGHPLGCT